MVQMRNFDVLEQVLRPSIPTHRFYVGCENIHAKQHGICEKFGDSAASSEDEYT